MNFAGGDGNVHLAAAALSRNAKLYLLFGHDTERFVFYQVHYAALNPRYLAPVFWGPF